MASEEAEEPQQWDGAGNVGLEKTSEEKRLWEITVCLAVSLGIMTETMRRDAVEARQDTHAEVIHFVQILTGVCVAFIGFGLWHISIKKNKKGTTKAAKT